MVKVVTGGDVHLHKAKVNKEPGVARENTKFCYFDK